MPRGGARPNSGGSRPGAGRKKKPLADKLLDGNPGKTPLTVMKFPEQPAPSAPPPPARLEDLAAELFSACTEWLSGTGCLHLIPPWYIEQYAMCAARWCECDKEFGQQKVITHPDTGMLVASPYAALADMYFKHMITADRRIWEIVKDNSQQKFNPGDMHDATMQQLIAKKNK